MVGAHDALKVKGGKLHDGVFILWRVTLELVCYMPNFGGLFSPDSAVNPVLILKLERQLVALILTILGVLTLLALIRVIWRFWLRPFERLRVNEDGSGLGSPRVPT